MLETMIELCDNVVTLQPVHVFQKNIDGQHDRCRSTLGSKIDSFEIVDTSLFDISADGDCAIMSFNSKHRVNWDDVLIKWTALQERIHQQIVNLKLQTVRRNVLYQTGDHFIVVPTRHGNIDAGVVRWDYYDLFSREYRVDSLGAKTNVTLRFKTYDEAENFRASVFTVFYKYVIMLYKKTTNSSLSLYPVMNDYRLPWTNERFYELFEISDAERAEIEMIMERFV
jgi:hypothetical protein